VGRHRQAKNRDHPNFHFHLQLKSHTPRGFVLLPRQRDTTVLTSGWRSPKVGLALSPSRRRPTCLRVEGETAATDLPFL
jgi:hypothetical protein